MPERLPVEAVIRVLRVFFRIISRTPAVLPLGMLLVPAWQRHRIRLRAGDGGAIHLLTDPVLVLGLADGLLFAALPHLGISFGPVGLLWLVLALMRTELGLVARLLGRRLPGKLALITALLWAFNLAVSAGEVYAFWIEPFNLGVSRVRVDLPATAPQPVRIVQISDVHIERTTRRERDVLATVERLQPDLLLLTGDYLNLSYLNDATARRDGHEFFSQLRAPYGVYAVRGSVDGPDVLAALVGGLDNVTVLQDEVVRLDLKGQPVYLIGVANLGLERDRASLRKLVHQCPPDAYTILLYHTPDLAETAAELGVDLYLAGHTHGGQVRLPGYGAVVTASRYGKRFEAGLYRVGDTRLYVSRGIGFEGEGAPRARFLCPPEVVELTLEPGD